MAPPPPRSVAELAGALRDVNAPPLALPRRLFLREPALVLALVHVSEET